MIDDFGFHSDLASQEFTFFLGNHTFLFEEDLNIDFGFDTLNLLGCSCAETILDGQSETHMLTIESGTVNVRNLSFHNGENVFGGAVYISDFNEEEDLAAAIFNSYDTCYVNNKAIYGGAIMNNGGFIGVIDHSTFKSNAAANGGAIFNAPSDAQAFYPGAIYFIQNSTFTDNQSNTNAFDPSPTFNYKGNSYYYGDGGAIYNLGQILSIDKTVFDSNFAYQGAGGAIATVRFAETDFNAAYGLGYTAVTNSTFTHNQAFSPDFFSRADGGAIYVEGELAVMPLIHGDFNANVARSDGGAIYYSGDYLLDNPNTLEGIYGTFTMNKTIDFFGGAIANTGDLRLHTITAVFDNNSALRGGGIWTDGPIGWSATDYPDGIVGSTFIHNTARESGGGLYIAPTPTNSIQPPYFSENIVDRVELSSFIYNTAAVNGGAIFIAEGSGTETSAGGENSIINLLQNNTISHNTAGTNGGGIFNVGVINFAYFNTIAFNEAGAQGSGIWSSARAGDHIRLGNNLIAYNADNADLYGTNFVSLGYNIVGDDLGNSNFSSITGDYFGNLVTLLDFARLDPNLTLGSPTVIPWAPIPAGQEPFFTFSPYYHVLLPDSGAIDNANPLATDGLNYDVLYDQRVLERPFDGDGNGTAYADIGAYEFGATQVYVVTPIVLDLDGDGIELISPHGSGITVANQAGTFNMGWVSGEDGILVYDLNQDGIVNSLDEIALSRYHPDATTDLQGLQLAFDSNQDNVFDNMDETFAHFGVWQDINQNGVSEVGEFKTLMEAGIESIALEGIHDAHWESENFIYTEGVYTMTDGSEGLFGDVALTLEDIGSAESITFVDGGLPAVLDGQDMQSDLSGVQGDENLIQLSDPMVAFSIEEGGLHPDLTL